MRKGHLVLFLRHVVQSKSERIRMRSSDIQHGTIAWFRADSLLDDKQQTMHASNRSFQRLSENYSRSVRYVVGPGMTTLLVCSLSFFSQVVCLDPRNTLLFDPSIVWAIQIAGNSSLVWE